MKVAIPITIGKLIHIEANQKFKFNLLIKKGKIKLIDINWCVKYKAKDIFPKNKETLFTIMLSL